MPEIELVLGLLVAVAALGILARRVNVPYPIVLVLGGLLLGLAPLHPTVLLAPELVFLLFLPPLLYIAAFFTSIRDFRAQAKPILLLAIGLVLATTAVVAVVAHALVPGLAWPAAFALGAIVSPPDAVAATAIFRQVRPPRNVITVLEGESMLNDATGLVAYRFAVVATVSGAFSFAESLARLLFVAVVGALIGFLVAWLVGRLRNRLNDPPIEITISLLTPYAAYLPADAIGASGVIATVAAGLYLGRQAPRIMQAATRVQGRAVWDTLVYLLTGLVFVLIGLQLPTLVDVVSSRPPEQVLIPVVAVCLAVVLVRFVWVFVTDLPRLMRNPMAWREDVVVSWVGMRGVVSLAAALALPLDFPERELILVITISVIAVTLVGQGLTLSLVLRLMGLHSDGSAEHEEAMARESAYQAAVARIDALAEEWPGHLPLIETLRAQYTHRGSHLGEEHLTEAEQELVEHRAIRNAVITAEREALLGLRDAGQINDDTLRTVERELDFEELRMEA